MLKIKEPVKLKSYNNMCILNDSFAKRIQADYALFPVHFTTQELLYLMQGNDAEQYIEQHNMTCVVNNTHYNNNVMLDVEIINEFINRFFEVINGKYTYQDRLYIDRFLIKAGIHNTNSFIKNAIEYVNDIKEVKSDVEFINSNEHFLSDILKEIVNNNNSNTQLVDEYLSNNRQQIIMQFSNRLLNHIINEDNRKLTAFNTIYRKSCADISAIMGNLQYQKLELYSAHMKQDIIFNDNTIDIQLHNNPYEVMWQDCTTKEKVLEQLISASMLNVLECVELVKQKEAGADIQMFINERNNLSDIITSTVLRMVTGQNRTAHNITADNYKELRMLRKEQRSIYTQLVEAYVNILSGLQSSSNFTDIYAMQQTSLYSGLKDNAEALNEDITQILYQDDNDSYIENNYHINENVTLNENIKIQIDREKAKKDILTALNNPIEVIHEYKKRATDVELYHQKQKEILYEGLPQDSRELFEKVEKILEKKADNELKSMQENAEHALYADINNTQPLVTFEDYEILQLTEVKDNNSNTSYNVTNQQDTQDKETEAAIPAIKDREVTDNRVSEISAIKDREVTDNRVSDIPGSKEIVGIQSGRQLRISTKDYQIQVLKEALIKNRYTRSIYALLADGTDSYNELTEFFEDRSEQLNITTEQTKAQFYEALTYILKEYTEGEEDANSLIYKESRLEENNNTSETIENNNTSETIENNNISETIENNNGNNTSDISEKGIKKYIRQFISQNAIVKNNVNNAINNDSYINNINNSGYNITDLSNNTNNSSNDITNLSNNTNNSSNSIANLSNSTNNSSNSIVNLSNNTNNSSNSIANLSNNTNNSSNDITNLSNNANNSGNSSINLSNNTNNSSNIINNLSNIINNLSKNTTNTVYNESTLINKNNSDLVYNENRLTENNEDSSIFTTERGTNEYINQYITEKVIHNNTINTNNSNMNYSDIYSSQQYIEYIHNVLNISESLFERAGSSDYYNYSFNNEAAFFNNKYIYMDGTTNVKGSISSYGDTITDMGDVSFVYNNDQQTDSESAAQPVNYSTRLIENDSYYNNNITVKDRIRNSVRSQYENGGVQEISKFDNAVKDEIHKYETTIEKNIQKNVEHTIESQIANISERVYSNLEKRLSMERKRRGY